MNVDSIYVLEQSRCGWLYTGACCSRGDCHYVPLCDCNDRACLRYVFAQCRNERHAESTLPRGLLRTVSLAPGRTGLVGGLNKVKVVGRKAAKDEPFNNRTGRRVVVEVVVVVAVDGARSSP